MAKKKKKNKARVLIVGHGRHGKDILSNVLENEYGYPFRGSSEVMCEELYQEHFADRYESHQELFENRHKHRVELYDLICDYNKEDQAKLARLVCGDNGEFGYTGLRAFEEVMACIEQDVFTHIVWVERRDAPLDPTMTFSFEDLYEEFMREDTSFSLAKVYNYPLSSDWCQSKSDEEIDEAVYTRLFSLIDRRNFKNFLDKSNTFSILA